MQYILLNLDLLANLRIKSYQLAKLFLFQKKKNKFINSTQSRFGLSAQPHWRFILSSFDSQHNDCPPPQTTWNVYNEKVSISVQFLVRAEHTIFVEVLQCNKSRSWLSNTNTVVNNSKYIECLSAQQTLWNLSLFYRSIFF